MARRNDLQKHPSLHARIVGFLEQHTELCAADISRLMNGYAGKSIRNRMNMMRDAQEIHISRWCRSLGSGGRPVPYYSLGWGKDAEPPVPLRNIKNKLVVKEETTRVLPTRTRYSREDGEFNPFVQLYRPAVDFIPDEALEILRRPSRF